MGLLREIALAVLSISLLTFLALFGRIPAFRKTPIGYIYRFVWIRIPGFFLTLDSIICGGRLKLYTAHTGQYLLHANHPLILLFFLTLLICSELSFIPVAWSKLEPIHQLFVPIVVIQPYMFLYLSVYTKSTITPKSHAGHMQLYPYDRIIFHPGNFCRTCKFLKPARSKHCSLCNVCVARHDHHCIWLRNCVGKNNHAYFLSLLVSTSLLLGYGAFLGYRILDGSLKEALALSVPASSSSHHWSNGLSWSICLEIWMLAIANDIRIGAVFLLATLTAPLSAAMFCYHLYLIWAGMTTNESAKWSDWRDDVAAGTVFQAKSSQIYGRHEGDAITESEIHWPKLSDQTLVFTTDGRAPKEGYTPTKDRFSILQPQDTNAEEDPRWTRVTNMKEVVNLYDCGFLNNLVDSLDLRGNTSRI
ncbi:palmitoyltransferase swf1 [Ophidiomyces ophidiicola]|uniref:palmitoyltransferase swf1 n=1 Tax=Ophidiomyces ophidiicola TaxID=1387563 RepID=UPI0020C1BE6E|nr:palmitoyltransferase swf1 [Ophidiomyces ophidiicola]KAI1937473.1 palmitoyltransferase swf1 [Ophidiomyces ophidiicola]KAI2057188.1 palmitoyltransferase swf1 [Ophidiomyces ophidiicola]